MVFYRRFLSIGGGCTFAHLIFFNHFPCFEYSNSPHVGIISATKQFEQKLDSLCIYCMLTELPVGF